MTYLAPPIVWLIGALIVIYNALLWYALDYVKRTHEAAWIQWGRPSYTNVLPVFGFMFGGRYRSVKDSRLTLMVWAVRSLFASCLLLILMGKLLHLIPPR